MKRIILASSSPRRIEMMKNNGYEPEIIPADGSNDKGDIELTTGRIVVTYHSDIEKDPTFDGVANKEFFDSLQVGDVLTAVGMWGNDVNWLSVANNEDRPTFTKIGHIDNLGDLGSGNVDVSVTK